MYAISAGRHLRICCGVVVGLLSFHVFVSGGCGFCSVPLMSKGEAHFGAWLGHFDGGLYLHLQIPADLRSSAVCNPHWCFVLALN